MFMFSSYVYMFCQIRRKKINNYLGRLACGKLFEKKRQLFSLHEQMLIIESATFNAVESH